MIGGAVRGGAGQCALDLRWKITQNSHPPQAQKSNKTLTSGQNGTHRGEKRIEGEVRENERAKRREGRGVRSKDQKGTWTIPEKMLDGQTSRAPMSQIGAMQSVAAG
jgi:hypothetical protein